MRSIFLAVVVIAIPLLVGIISCSDGSSESDDFVISANESSELAVLMRHMFDDAELMKAHIAQGMPAATGVDFRDILTAEATEPEKSASPEFQIFSESYFVAMESLSNCAPEDADSLFLSMVSTCENCHRTLCPGPLKRIKRLRN